MELTLKRLLEDAEFKKYRGKGYDPAEVDDFLDRAAAMASKVEVELTQALEAARRGGGGAPSGPSAAEVEAEIERRVAERIAELPAPEPAEGPSVDDIAEESRRLLALAQRTADAAVREAREDADRILTEARERADALVSEAEAKANDLEAETTRRADAARAELESEVTGERTAARSRLAAEIGELEAVRESLRTDVGVLERHVEEQRTQLGSTLAELQQILDDPAGFRMAPVPPLIDPELPDFSDLDEPATPAAEEAPAPEPVQEAAPEPAPSAEPVAPDALSFGDVDHEPPSVGAMEPAEIGPADDPTPAAPEAADADADPIDAGPPTAPVAAVGLGFGPTDPPSTAGEIEEDDEFLAELRKAMADDEPLGPRDPDEVADRDRLFGEDEGRGWRFGRRR